MSVVTTVTVTETTPTATTAMDKLIAHASKQDTQTLFEAIVLLGGGTLPTEANMARAAMIEVYEQREGEEAADALMDLIGL
jgi:hypothetical protein